MNHITSPNSVKREGTAVTGDYHREYQSSMRDSRTGENSPTKSGFNVSFFDQAAATATQPQ